MTPPPMTRFVVPTPVEAIVPTVAQVPVDTESVPPPAILYCEEAMWTLDWIMYDSMVGAQEETVRPPKSEK